MKNLKLADKLSLPLDAVTETFAILGRRGSGKTHTASVFCEELLAAGQQCVIVDPLDAWFGLRSSADGKANGFPITIFGGSRADLPLEPSAGTLLADVVVEQRISAIFSLRHLSKSDLRRFVGEFAERLYERKGRPEYREPLHVVFDEADAVVPQRILPGGERAYGAVDTLVRRGRSSGIGTTLISQRPAVVAKDVLTQTEILICHQTSGPQDRKALEAWIEAHDTEDRGEAFLESLAGLQKGEAWIWSPSLLDVFQRVKIRPRRTFDSSATPKVGVKAAPAAKLAPVDLEALRGRIAATLERTKADDPKELRKRIAELEKQLKAKAPAAAKATVERVEVPVFDEKALDAFHEALFEHVGAIQAAAGIAKQALGRQLVEYRKACRSAVVLGQRGILPGARERLLHRDPKPANVIRETTRPKRETNGASHGTALRGGELACLTAIAQHPNGVTREQLSVLTGYTRSSRNTFLQRLAAAGYIEYRNDRIDATPEGVAALGSDFEPLPTGLGLQRFWLEKLTGGERAIFEVLVNAYPKVIDRETISETTGYTRSSRNTFLQRLGARELVENQGGGVKASKELFE